MLVSYTIPTALNWGYRAEFTPGVCLGLRDRRCIWPRGKVLGGTSVINYMLYTRGNRIDYDLWEASGNPGWGYEEILRYFLKVCALVLHCAIPLKSAGSDVLTAVVVVKYNAV